MKVKWVTGTLRDFGTSWDIWSEAFLNYAMIMVDFFDAAPPTLFRVLIFFLSKIWKLSKIYTWQSTVLPLAIDYHTEITTGNHTNADMWTLPQDWIDQYCSPDHTLGTSLSKKQGAASSLDGHTNKKKTVEICQNFNTKSYLFKGCSREHKCTDCGSKDYEAHVCTKHKQWQLAAEHIRGLARTPCNADLLNQFISCYPCSPAPLRPNANLKFKFVDPSQPLLAYSPSLFKIHA